jgi:CheY-like chemotaxis protein
MGEGTAQGRRGGIVQRSHVLVLNDDQAVLDLFRELLSDEGYRVTTQRYALRDLAEIERLAPDLIILDYMWPGDDNGWSMLQMLKMNPATADIPCVLCSAAVREIEALQPRLDEMGVRVVLKPFNLDELLAAAAAALADHPAARRADAPPASAGA